MTFEDLFYSTLGPLFAGELYPFVADSIEATPRPYAIYTDIGGTPVTSLCGGSSGPRNIVIQLNLWAETAKAAKALALEAERIMTSAPLLGTARTNPIALWEETLRLYGYRQDVSFWV